MDALNRDKPETKDTKKSIISLKKKIYLMQYMWTNKFFFLHVVPQSWKDKYQLCDKYQSFTKEIFLDKFMPTFNRNSIFFYVCTCTCILFFCKHESVGIQYFVI